MQGGERGRGVCQCDGQRCGEDAGGEGEAYGRPEEEELRPAEAVRGAGETGAVNSNAAALAREAAVREAGHAEEELREAFFAQLGLVIPKGKLRLANVETEWKPEPYI